MYNLFGQYEFYTIQTAQRNFFVPYYSDAICEAKKMFNEICNYTADNYAKFLFDGTELDCFDYDCTVTVIRHIDKNSDIVLKLTN